MTKQGGPGTNLYLGSPHVLPCGPHGPPTLPPPHAPASSVLLLGSAVLRNALGSQFSQHIIQVVGIWVAVASEIRAKLGLVVDLVPDDGVRLARGAGGADGKDEAAIPGHQQQLEDLRQQRPGPEADTRCWSQTIPACRESSLGPTPSCILRPKWNCEWKEIWLWSRGLQVQSWLCHQLTARAWISYINPLSFNFLTQKTAMAQPASKGCEHLLALHEKHSAGTR